nr:serine peptidase [Gammaproteobacteria bacterium]
MKRFVSASRLATPLLMVAFLLFADAAGARTALPDFTELVDKLGPAVVNISTTQRKAQRRSLPKGFEMPDIPEDSPFNDF